MTRYILGALLCICFLNQPSMAQSAAGAERSGRGCDHHKEEDPSEEDIADYGDLDSEHVPEPGETFYTCEPTFNCMSDHGVDIDELEYEWSEGIHPFWGTPLSVAVCTICENNNNPMFCKCKDS